MPFLHETRLTVTSRNNIFAWYKYEVLDWEYHSILYINIMQQSAALLFVLLVAVALAEAARIRRDDKYTTKYDSINVDEILESERLRNNYINCVLEKGKCTPEGTELRCEYWIWLHVTHEIPRLKHPRLWVEFV
jgi:hypothetical protein